MAKVDYATLKKGGFMRQKQKNNFSLRLACVGGTLTAENLKKIAEVAEKYGDGYVHLTSRQGVEIPFIKLDDIDDVKDDLAKGGCKPGVCGPRVRTVTACQGNAVCPSGNINSYDIAVKLNERYFGRELPPRWITSLEQPAAKPLLLYFLLRDLSSMSFVLLDGLISAAAQISPVSSSAAKSTFSISCSGATSMVAPHPTVMP